MRVLFITNILTPYRMALYDELKRVFLEENDGSELLVAAMTDALPFRTWHYADLKRDYTTLLTGFKVFNKQNDVLINYGVRKHLNNFDPDYVVLAGSWTYPTIFEIALLKNHYFRKDTKLLFWYESHDNASEAFKATSLKDGPIMRLKRRFLRQFDGFCVPGDLAKSSVSKFVSNDNFIYLRNAVDGEYYAKANDLRENKVSFRHKYGIDEDTVAILVPARLIKLKGIDELLSRIDPVNVERYNFEFVFAGEGDQKEIIEEIANDKKIKAVFLGYQKQDNIRELLSACDYFCLPSLTDANPLSAIEAAWAGLPLLMSKYTGNYPELIVQGINGTVFDPLNNDSVNRMIEWAMSKGSQWRECASITSNRIAKEKFDTTQIADYFIEQLRGL